MLMGGVPVEEIIAYTFVIDEPEQLMHRIHLMSLLEWERMNLVLDS